MSMPDLIVPPHSIESEQGLLGGLLLDGEAIHRIGDLEAGAFYLEFHAIVFRAIHDLVSAGKACDVLTVGELLKASGAYDSRVFGDLNALAQYVPSAANVRRYAEIVMERYRSRLLMAAGSEITGLAMSNVKPSEQIDQAQMLLAKLAMVKSKREPQHINQSLADYLGQLQDLSEGKNPAIPSGIAGLDRLLNGGVRRGEMMVIGARPKHGKTALALALARNFSRNHSVLFMSQEMPVSQLMHRHTAAMGSVDLGRILRADATDHEMWERVTEAAERLGRLNLVHDDQSSLTLIDVRRKAINVKRQYGLDVLFVDFLQLMQGAGEDNRNRELDVIVNGIKALALDLGIAVVVLSQMSRKADEYYGRPTMTHLRDSGAIEAAADQIALLFTDHAHPLSKREPGFKGYSELEIVAHRNGANGLVHLSFIGELQQIGEWSGNQPQLSKSTSRSFE
jgi:replicative DNA helicase